MQRSQEPTVVGQSVALREYLVTLPVALVPEAALSVSNDTPWVTLTGVVPGYEGDVDPHLVGRSFKVVSVQKGSLLWERDLICVDDLTNGGV